MKYRNGLTLILFLFLTTTPAPAQQRRGGAGAAPMDILNLFDLLARAPAGAWWTNASLIERLGLTEEQKSGIERTFEAYRQNLTSVTNQLQTEEKQLATLLAAEPINRNAILTQIDRVVRARGEMERTNSVMTLEMREQLTRAQWELLQVLAPPSWNVGLSYVRQGGDAGVRGGGGRGARGPQ